jgi:hypothetical protein
MKINIGISKQANTAVVRKHGGSLKKYMIANFNKAWRHGAREGIRAIAEEIVVDTGMSKASLLPLAAKVRLKAEISTQILGGGKKKNTNENLSGIWASNNKSNNKYKSKAFGERLGRDAFEYQLGSTTGKDWKFSFDIPVFHYFLHENGIAPKGHFYNSLGRGAIAFKEAFDSKIVELLKPEDVAAFMVAEFKFNEVL